MSLDRKGLDELTKMLDWLADYYRRERLSTKVIGLYARGLRHHDIQTIVRAIDAHLADTDQGQYFPKLADINRHIGGTRNDRATIAWSKLQAAIRRVGPWPSVAFDDPIIHAVVSDLGGWATVNTWRDEELPFRERDFLRRYAACMRMSLVGHPPYLKGEIQARNESSGNAEIRYIGDPERARAIARGEHAGAGARITISTDRDQRALPQPGQREPAAAHNQNATQQGAGEITLSHG